MGNPTILAVINDVEWRIRSVFLLDITCIKKSEHFMENLVAMLTDNIVILDGGGNCWPIILFLSWAIVLSR